MRAILVGRHAPDFGAEQIEVIETRNIQFPVDSTGCMKIVRGLVKEAREMGEDVKVLFQMIPGQLAAALSTMSRDLRADDDVCSGRVGIIVAVPGPREAGVSQDFNCGSDYESGHVEIGGELIRAVRFANGRAKTEMVGDCGVRVTVDPVPKFVFSHIEWL